MNITKFPYALRRDIVLNPTLLDGAVTSSNTARLHRLVLSLCPAWPVRLLVNVFLLVVGLHR